MEKIIITGGNGYIGSHMCRLMHEKGFDVHVIDNHSTSPKRKVHKFGTFHKIDISDKKKIQPLLKKLKPSAVFHFAARATVPESQEKPFLYYNENLVKTVALLESCVMTKVKNFIFSSTCATFGVPEKDTLSEDHPQRPINTYGLTKLLMEKVMNDLAEKKLINVIIFRYFNAAGCSPDSKIGEEHNPENHLIPNLCRALLLGKKSPFHLFGTDFPTPDGTAIRDYIHVDDLALAHFQGFEFLKSNSGYFDFNLGSEKGYSVKEVIEAFNRVSKTKLDVTTSPRRPGDPPKLVGNSTKAKNLLKYDPKYSLEECIKHSLDYYKKVLL
jgi:UDP-glucose 4-epimerase